MQNTSETWKDIIRYDGENFSIDTKFVINEKEYKPHTKVIIDRKAVADALSVGNCFNSSMQSSILTDDVIPQGSAIQCFVKVKKNGIESEYIPQGVFYIDSRKKDYDGSVSFTCFDSMLMANVPYLNEDSDKSQWPKYMGDVVNEIAQRMGVEIDERTTIQNNNPAYIVPYPENYTMADVLGFIGACHGGNWIITEENKLRLIPIIQFDATDTVNVPIVLGDVSTGNLITVKGVKISGTDGIEYISEDETDGFFITASANPYISQTVCNDLKKMFSGKSYVAYNAIKSTYSPAAQLGDKVVIDGYANSYLMSKRSEFDIAFVSDISAPDITRAESEYPLPDKTEQLKREINSRTDRVVESVTQDASESVIKALGYYKTVVTDEYGATYVYFHNLPQLSLSTYIFYFGGDGFKWAEKWKGSHETTEWFASLDARGNLIIRTLQAIKIVSTLMYGDKPAMEIDLNNNRIISRSSNDALGREFAAILSDAGLTLEAIHPTDESESLQTIFTPGLISLVTGDSPIPAWALTRYGITTKSLRINSSIDSNKVEYVSASSSVPSWISNNVVGVRNTGDKAELRGFVSFRTRTSSSASTPVLLRITDENLKPKRIVYKFVPCAGNNVARLVIATNGDVSIDYVQAIGGSEVFNTNITWLQLDTDWEI